MRQPRVSMEAPAFEVGQIVRIRSVIASRHAGQLGRVVERRPASRGTASLDKYLVMLSSGDQEVFWSIQLEKDSGAIWKME
jgi:hypothetical protein